MGNCIKISSQQSREKIKLVVFNGGADDIRASKSVEKITAGPYIGFKLVHHSQPHSPLSPNSKLESDDLIPCQTEPGKPLVSPKRAKQASCNRQKVKVVVTRDQLELLLRTAQKLQPRRNFAVRLCEKSYEKGSLKWQPSLPTIPEVHGF